MSVIVPTNDNEAVPAPVTVTLPAEAADSVPVSTVNVAVTLLFAESESDTVIPVNARVTSSSVVQPGGNVIDGGSLTATTVMVATSVSDSGPPDPVLPPSSTAIVSVTSPLKFGS